MIVAPKMVLPLGLFSPILGVEKYAKIIRFNKPFVYAIRQLIQYFSPSAKHGPYQFLKHKLACSQVGIVVNINKKRNDDLK